MIMFLSILLKKQIPFTGSAAGCSFPTTAQAFAADLCVTDQDVNTGAIIIGAEEAALFNMEGQEVVYAKDIFTPRSPASMTKVMTALVGH